MMRSRLAPLVLLALLACDRSHPPSPPPSTQAEKPAWTWHRMGDYIAIDGEVDHPTRLTLAGPSTHIATAADFGPVHWEFRSPILGEPVTLTDADGKVLANWIMKGETSESSPALAKAEPPAAKPTQATKSRDLAKLIPPPPKSHRSLPAPAPPVEAPAPSPIPRRLEGMWPGAGEAVNLTAGPRHEKLILLSFDGGSSDEAANEILTTLESRHLRTTIFLTGAFIERFPEVVKRIVADGHEVGNHTFDHPHFAPQFHRDPRWTEGRVQEELLRADEAFYRLTGRPMDPFWRSPYGENTKEIRAWAEAIGYRHVGWSDGADSLDWATPKERGLYRSGPAILEKLLTRMGKDGNGLIVLMHLGSERPEADRPAAHLGAFIDKARALGWRFVTASEMLRLSGQPPWNREHRMALLQRTTTSGGR